MDDLISRQAAIKWCRPEEWGTPDERWRPESEYGAMLEALPHAQPEQRWIPCKERLPEIGDTYIVTGIQKDPHEKEWHYFVDVASNYGDYIDDYWDTFNDWIEGQETHIVAWKRLPKPYKMDEVKE